MNSSGLEKECYMLIDVNKIQKKVLKSVFRFCYSDLLFQLPPNSFKMLFRMLLWVCNIYPIGIGGKGGKKGIFLL